MPDSRSELRQNVRKCKTPSQINATRINFQVGKQSHHQQTSSKSSVAHDIQLLKKLFKRALRKARRRRYMLFLELFSGHGGLSASLNANGYATLSFEIENGPHFDVTKRHIINLIKGWISSNCLLGVWLGTPCSSWSRARRGPPGSSWCQIRSSSHILGMPNLKAADQEKILLGNATAKASSDITFAIASETIRLAVLKILVLACCSIRLSLPLCCVIALALPPLLITVSSTCPGVNEQDSLLGACPT